MAGRSEVLMRDVSNACLAVSNCISRDSAISQLDLEEALEASRYASHPYTAHPREWPPLVEVVDTWGLPPVLVERYTASGGEGTALCGIFPEIRRAWASIDNTFFLWRFDKSYSQCIEYNVEEQAICSIGLAKTKPGIFIEAIQYLLVLATPVELMLVGVCCSRRGDGTDPYFEVTLQPLPEYRIPSDGVTMTCISCTDRGEIFLSGRDGHIYEMKYTTGSTWQKRCRKVCLTTGLGSAISRWVVPNVFKFAAVDPIVEMVVDNERRILYARTEQMKIQVFSLGSNGDGNVKKVAEERNLLIQKDISYGGRQPSGSGTPSRSSKISIVCLSPISPLESKSLHLVVILSDGKRMYLTTGASGGSGGGLGDLGGNQQGPSCIKVVATRPPPPLGVGGGFGFGITSLAGRTQNEDLSLRVESGYYSAGTLVLSDSSASTSSSLLLVNKDASTQSSSSGNFGAGVRVSRALKESVSSLPMEGKMLFVADVLPLPGTAAVVQSLYLQLEFCGFDNIWESCEKASGKLWARGDLSTQHILPRRRIVIFSTVGMTEVVFNRPIDILRKLFESSSPRSLLEDFFSRFGAAEAAAMCLMLAAGVISTECLITNIVAQKAAEAFEDPRLVGIPQLEGSGALPSTRTSSGGFSMGQVVQEAEPVFSGSYEGLCLCSSRLLLPLWDLPVFVAKSANVSSDAAQEDLVVFCRLSVGAMRVLEDKFRAIEKFISSRRDQRRGLYGCVAGMGDLTGSILIGTGSDLGASDRSMVRNLFGSRNDDSSESLNKRQRLPYSPAELAAMEVRSMECIRQLLLRCGEALFLLQLLSEHHVTRLVHGFEADMKRSLVQLTFHRLVCEEDGDKLATRLISSLMEFYTGPDGRGMVDDISAKLRDGCSSFYKESDYKFYLAVECLERAASTCDAGERDNLAREAFGYLSKVPESADLPSVCKRFEELRFYEAVVRLPLQKAQALDPAGYALNEQIDAGTREHALAQREQCYVIIANALRALKGGASQKGFSSPPRSVAQVTLDQAARKKFICQIVQLGVQSPDRIFHEYLYRALIDLGLEDELLEYGGPDLVPFLQNAGREPSHEVLAVTAVTPTTSPGQSMVPMRRSQMKYLELLARYYVLKRQHILAAHVLVRLAERRSSDEESTPPLEERRQYLSNAVIQAKSATDADSLSGTAQASFDNGLLDLLEGKLAVINFQIAIKAELEAMASRLDASSGTSVSALNNLHSENGLSSDSNLARTIQEKAKELSLDLKSITQLYNEYAVPFELWEICLDMLCFASYSSGPSSSIVKETWVRLIDQALSRGGISEACAVLKRVGSRVYPGDGAVLPLDTLCLQLEKAALDRIVSGVESVGDEEIPRAFLATCNGAAEPVLNAYDQLSFGAILPSPNLRLRLLRSVLVVLRELAVSVLARKASTTAPGASIIFSPGQTGAINQGIRDKITNAANRYMTEVRRLPLPHSQTEAVAREFRELEESLLSPYSFNGF